MAERVTASDVKALLRTRYAHPEWALCFEVANATGATQRRYADAVAMNLFPSRGLALHGFEIKVSKADFMSEIRKPEKSVDVQQYCDHWWIVAPASAVDESLIPTTWGWLRVDGGRLVSAKNAPKLEAKEMERPFIAALVRRANAADADEVNKLVAARVAGLREGDRERMEREVAIRTRAATEASETLKKLKDKLGDDGWRMLDDDAICAAVKMLQAAGISRTYDNVRKIEKDLERAHKRVAKALDEALGKQLDMLQAAE